MRTAIPVLIAGLAACGPAAGAPPGKETGACVDAQCLGPELVCLSEVCVDPDAAPDATAGSGTDDDGTGGVDDGGPTGSTNKVDVLFVIDNSGSMGEEQGTLANDAVAFVGVLDAAGAEYRIGFTTTDSGNPWCNGTTPEGGRLRASSCRSRAGEFVYAGFTPIDATEEACLEPCKYDAIEISPTTTDSDETPTPRPWLEGGPGTNNLGEGTCAAGATCDSAPTIVDAFQCMAPQGIDGCGFEQPLESMYTALARSELDQQAESGFIRSDAVLAVIVVTDEVDCSYNPEQETIFRPEDDRFFWSLKDEGAPTSAVCWNAGVQCTGSTCSSKDVDPLGQATSPDNAVMRPVSRYLDALTELERDQQALDVDRQVVFTLIAGVGTDGSVAYHESLDRQFQDNFGIGPGCTSDAGEALPPVRMREVAEGMQFDAGQTMFSLCDSTYRPALEAIAVRIVGELGR